MRNVSADLAAAASSLSATPAVFLAVEDRPPMAERIDPTPVNLLRQEYDHAAYCGPTSDGPFLCVYRRDDGSVWAMRTDLAGNTGETRLGAPGSATLDEESSPTVAVCGSGDIIRAFWITWDRHNVATATSIDGGRTWGTVVEVSTIPDEIVNGIAAAWTTSGEVLFAIVDLLPPGHYLGATRFNAGWGTFTYLDAAFEYPWWGGIAADGDLSDQVTSAVYLLVIDGDGGNQRVRGARYNAATEEWGETNVLFENMLASGFSLKWPTILAKGHGGAEQHLLAWLEMYTGNPAYTRTMYAFTPLITTAPPATPWQYTTHGPRNGILCRGPAYDYLAAQTFGYRWPRWTASAVQRRDDLGAFVTRVEAKQSEDKAGQLTIHLSDAGGRFAGAGVVGSPLQMLREGSTLNLGLGYVTPNGPEYGYQQGWVIADVARRQIKGKKGAGSTSELVLSCVDGLGWLRMVTPYYTQTHTNQSNYQNLEFCLALLTGSYFVEPNASTAETKAWFQLATSASLAGVFVKLLNGCGLIASWHGVQSATAPANQNPVSLYGYAYWSDTHHHIGGDGGLPVVDVDDTRVADVANHVEVYGGEYVPGQPSPAFGEAWDVAALRRHEKPLTLRWFDVNSPTDAGAARAAENVLYRLTYRRQRSEVLLPYQPAIELGDLAQLSDAFLGLEEATRYVRQVQTTLDPTKGVYTSKLVLEASIV